MKNYHYLLSDILHNGEDRDDRTKIGTKAVFGRQLRFDLRNGFPAVTTKKLAWKAVVGELLWFLEGSSDERRLAEITHGTRDGAATIWTPNALASYWKDKANFPNDLGRVYGVQWRRWQKHEVMCDFGKTWNPDAKRTATDMTEIDQIKNLIDGIRNDPNGRRHIITAWNVGQLDEMALPPCHVMSQFYVSNRGELSCHMYQRSVDAFLGLPFNIASYALLTHMIAQICDLKVGELIISAGDAHIYKNHVAQVNELLTRSPMKDPTLWLNPDIKSIDDFTMDDIKLVDYQSHPALTAPMAV